MDLIFQLESTCSEVYEFEKLSNVTKSIFESYALVDYLSTKEYDINLLHCVFLLQYKSGCGTKYTNNKLQMLQDKDMILLLENNLRGYEKTVLGVRHVKASDNKKILNVDANTLGGWAMIKTTPYDEVKYGHKIFWNLKIIVTWVIFLKLSSITQMK